MIVDSSYATSTLIFCSNFFISLRNWSPSSLPLSPSRRTSPAANIVNEGHAAVRRHIPPESAAADTRRPVQLVDNALDELERGGVNLRRPSLWPITQTKMAGPKRFPRETKLI
ncbi:hypothetical protein AAHA92_22330 [Salvia divinorum]|uniref:Uncharacterized protein n=1 Tax=Salvia divinorum TaxID=28513 RepID=A0ABD1GNC5_SALDI